MPKVLCELRHASASINGVTFEKTEKGMLSEEVSNEVAEGFAGIAGYSIIESKPKTPAELKKEAADKEAAEKAAAGAEKAGDTAQS